MGERLCVVCQAPVDDPEPGVDYCSECCREQEAVEKAE